jgi:hypothetical protein
VTIFKNQYFLNNKNHPLAILREKASDSLLPVIPFSVTPNKKMLLLLFFLFLFLVIFSIKIPFQRAQALGSTAKID